MSARSTFVHLATRAEILFGALFLVSVLLAAIPGHRAPDRKSTRLNSSHLVISYAVFCLKKKKNKVTLSIYHCSLVIIFATRITTSPLILSRRLPPASDHIYTFGTVTYPRYHRDLVPDRR